MGSDESEAGFGFVFYHNGNDPETFPWILNETLTFQLPAGFSLPGREETQFTVAVAPGTWECVPVRKSFNGGNFIAQANAFYSDGSAEYEHRIKGEGEETQIDDTDVFYYVL